jgi:ABC-type glutathione transport system ATPase component
MTVGWHRRRTVPDPPEVAPRGDRRAKVQELLEVVGLNPEHYNRYRTSSPAASANAIGIARALALRPQIIVCDEPVSALDVSVQAQVITCGSGCSASSTCPTSSWPTTCRWCATSPTGSR